MIYQYSLYGLVINCDFPFPFLKPLKHLRDASLIIKEDSRLRFSKKIDSKDTISNLNLRSATIENRFYKCKITDGSLIKYKFKENQNNLSLLINFLHMPFAFVMFQKSYLPLHGMSFLHKNKCIIVLGASGSGKSSLCSALSKTHKIKSEDITCIINRKSKNLSMPSFPITLSEAAYSKHLKKFSSKKISRKRFINYLHDSYDDKKFVEVRKIYILEWGEEESISRLEDSEAFKKLLINSFKPYPFNSCLDSDNVYFKNIMGLIRCNEIYLYRRKKENNISSHTNLIKHLENDSS